MDNGQWTIEVGLDRQIMPKGFHWCGWLLGDRALTQGIFAKIIVNYPLSIVN
jgi:hypothetical protein